MLRGLYAPTDFGSENLSPEINPAEKLDIIASSPATVVPFMRSGFMLSLPFGAVTTFFLMETVDKEEVCLYSEYVCVADADLRKQGLGSRLVRAACRFAVEVEERTATFSTNAARLGLVNTATNVFGQENVAVEGFGTRYGWLGQKPLEAMFDDYPPVASQKYIPGSIEAKIDREMLARWEMPAYYDPAYIS